MFSKIKFIMITVAPESAESWAATGAKNSGAQPPVFSE